MLDEYGGYDEAEKKRVYLTSDWLPLPKKNLAFLYWKFLIRKSLPS